MGSRALNPLAVSARSLGGFPQVWAGTSNNNRGPTVRLSQGSSDSPKEPRISGWVAGRSQRVPLLVLGLSSLLPLP